MRGRSKLGIWVALALMAVVAPGAAAKGGYAEKGVWPPTGATALGGVGGPPGSPSAAYRYTTDPAPGGATTVLKVATDGGAIDRQRWLDGDWALPAVTLTGEAGGLSADGRTLVLLAPDYDPRGRETEFLLLDAGTLRSGQRVELPGAFSFDAISPDGATIYLVEYTRPGDPLAYRIRAFDVGAGRLRPGEVVDPSEPDEKMTGQPYSRQTSPDGRWAYTLYGGGEETFIHALDTVGATAVCVDLDEIDPAAAHKYRLDVDQGTGELTVSRAGNAVAAVDPQSFEVSDVAAGEAGATGESVDPNAGGDWVGPVAIGCGVAVLAAACLLAMRRHRRAAA